MNDSDRNRSTFSAIYGQHFRTQLENYEALAKQAIAHRGEKGRVVEAAVRGALRVLLPKRFSLGTGFIVDASGSSSPQLDIVVYDEFFNAPYLMDGEIGIFPIESVYGFVEVKSVISGKDFSACCETISAVRQLAPNKMYQRYVKGFADEGGSIVQAAERGDQLPPRSYVLSVKTKLQSNTRFDEELRRATEEYDAHIHAIHVVSEGWTFCQEAYTKPHQFHFYEDAAFEKFCMSILHGVQSIPMAPASIGRYLDF